MATNKDVISTSQLFIDLSRNFKNGNYAEAQKIAGKILKMDANDVDALKCKIVCLLQQSSFKSALDSINSNEKKGLLKMDFEKAYCLYRLNRLKEAESVISQIPEKSDREKDLLAQVRYRMEDYKGCLDLYKDLVKNSDDDYGDEREANMAAVIAAAKLWKNQDMGVSHVRSDTYELCYNYACLQLAQGEMEKAKATLLNAETLCRQFLASEEDVTEEEIEDELSIIKGQLSYIYQLQGKADQALTEYNKVLKNKPSDVALTAVISNNIVAIHKDKDLFNSKKRLKAMSSEGLNHKLTCQQQEVMEVNKCLMMMYTNQPAQCRKTIEELKKNFTNISQERIALLEVAIFAREKQWDIAIDHLQKIVETGDCTDGTILTLAQLSLQKGKYEDVIKLLQKLTSIRYKPAVVSLCVSLYNILGEVEKASSYLDEAIKHCSSVPALKKDAVTFMRECSNMKFTSGDIESGVKMLERLRSEDPSEVSTLAKIVVAYSKIDPEKAKQYSVDLPSLDTSGNAALNLDVLEMTEMIGSFRFSKKRKTSVDETEAKEEAIMKRKRRKRKKGKLPKSYNPDVDPDPERWLPRWERSTYKYKKSKRNPGVGKGTQGAVGGGSAEPQPASPKPTIASPKSGSSSAGPSPSVVPPRQQKPGAKSKGKKKKKGGW